MEEKTKLLKKVIFSFTLIFAALLFGGCQDVIFSNIRKEVKLNDGTVSGSIRALVRYEHNNKEYIYLANGKAVYRKANSGNVADHKDGGWEKVCSGGSGGLGKYVVTLAADKDFLYAFAATWDENTSKGQNRWYTRAIYASKDGGFNWKNVKSIPTSPTGTGTDNSELYLFCTNTIKKDNRSAYFNVGGTGYKLDGLNDPSPETSANGMASCAYVTKTEFAEASGTYYGSASCTDENRNASGTTTTRYYSSGATLHWKGNANGNTSVGSRIYSLAVTKDYILVGTEDGIKHFRLHSEGNVGGEETDFATNADAIMSGGYEVNALLVVDPSKNETDNAIYSAIDFEGRSQQFDHVCIWAYYQERGNWNRD